MKKGEKGKIGSTRFCVSYVLQFYAQGEHGNETDGGGCRSRSG